MSAHLYIEGGESKEDQIRCREGFSRLIEKAGLEGRMPRLTASGSRNSAFDDFKTAHRNARAGDYVAMLIDSEDPVADIHQPWAHLKTRDNWDRPAQATDRQVVMMTTCMETWISADRTTLKKHYGAKLNEAALTPLENIETRNRHAVHDALEKATQHCKNAYRKGKRSFAVVKMLEPAHLEALPSFARFVAILKAELR